MRETLKKMKKKKQISILINFIILIFVATGVLAFIHTDSLSQESINCTSEQLAGVIKEQYNLLIISPTLFAPHLEPLVFHKNAFGINTKLVVLDEVYDEMQTRGRDDAEKIKYFIKGAMEKWGIEYVLLVGGRKDHFSAFEDWWLPVRYCHIEDNVGSTGYFEKRYLSDLYFADIYDQNGEFSTWDTNGNSVYGEWVANKSSDDVLDLYPDVAIGRLPCRNVFEVMVTVEKILWYEKEGCEDSWFKNLVAVGGDSTCTNEDYYEGEVSNQQAVQNMPGFTPIYLWTSQGTLTGQSDVIQAINDGCGFVYFAGHGSPRTWTTHPPHDEETWVTGLDLPHMLLLRNKGKLPICIVGGCHNSMFNISLFDSSWTWGIPCPECWSWRLTRKIGGGAIATISNTGLSYGPEYRQNSNRGGGEDWLEVRFFEEYGLNGTDILGKTWQKTVIAYLQNFPIDWNEKAFGDSALDAKTVQQWIVIGDPSLKMGGY